MAIEIKNIFKAKQQIKDKVLVTPMVLSHVLSRLKNTPVYLKLESLQPTGSFKLRGATNAVANLNTEQLHLGVVTASTGNHGLALAYAANNAGSKAVVCLSNLVPKNKVDALRNAGAILEIEGDSQDHALQKAKNLMQQQGLSLIPPFDHADVIAGQATIALEILEQLPETATVVVPLSGGGLLGGIAFVLKTIAPSINVIGVTMENGCAMHTSLINGKPTVVTEVATLADSLGGGIGLDNQYTFDLVRKYCDKTILVGEDSIKKAIKHIYQHERLVVEGAASVGVAALYEGALDEYINCGPMILLLTGQNIDMELHRSIIC